MNISINSSPTILAQAKEFLNRPVVKTTAAALVGLAVTGAVATLAYNKMFNNASNSTDQMCPEDFKDVMSIANQCVNTTLVDILGNNTMFQNVNVLSPSNIIPQQNSTNITETANKTLSKTIVNILNATNALTSNSTLNNGIITENLPNGEVLVKFDCFGKTSKSETVFNTIYQIFFPRF